MGLQSRKDDRIYLNTGLTADAAQTQAAGTRLTEGYNQVSTVASSGDSCRLPKAAPGMMIRVRNDGANSMALFPAPGENLTGTLNASQSVGPGTERTMFCRAAGIWTLEAGAQEQTNFKSYNFSARAASSGVYYLAGFLDAPAADANLDQAGATVVYGTANSPYAAHAFIVAGAAGVTDGSDLVLTVSGTSITDAGVRTPADSEVIVADCTAFATNQWAETTKKWIGQVTFTLSSTGGTAFSFDFNYGLAKYEDWGNKLFEVTDFEVVGLADAADAGFNVELIHYRSTGWTYDAAAFVPEPEIVLDFAADYNTENDLKAGEHFAYKRSGMSEVIDGSGSEGAIIRVTTSVNNCIAYMNAHLGVVLP